MSVSFLRKKSLFKRRLYCSVSISVECSKQQSQLARAQMCRKFFCYYFSYAIRQKYAVRDGTWRLFVFKFWDIRDEKFMVLKIRRSRNWIIYHIEWCSPWQLDGDKKLNKHRKKNYFLLANSCVNFWLMKNYKPYLKESRLMCWYLNF